jgi:hydroxypyruvate isomerase
MNRRSFLATGAALAATPAAMAASRQPSDKRFGMHFAPHFGMFRAHAGDDPVEQLKFAADVGFTAWEDNNMMGRTMEDQERIATAMAELDMRMGVFVLNPTTAWGSTFSRNDEADRDTFINEVKAGIEVAERVNAKWMTVVLGKREPNFDIGYQTAYAVDQLRAAATLLEPKGLVMVLEPLNPRNHPSMLLAKMSHAFEICRAVNSDSCKILCDLYHQQVTEGDLIENARRSWSEIGYFQIGDNPGRNEPTTGEVNYLKVFEFIKSQGFTGILGMEHGNSKSGIEGEEAVIAAYRACDPA